MTEKLYKAFTPVIKALDPDAGIYEAMITTETTDRQGDIVRATGGKLDNFLKNPVVLYAHNYDGLPVAKALSLEILPGQGIQSTFQFPEWGTSAEADAVRRLWAAGYLNAVSIGFIPLDWKPIDAKEPWGAQDFVSWELLEYSIVPVPANQEALRLAMKTYSDGMQKRGRVLSAVNEKRIRSASDLLSEVLSTLGEDEEPDKRVTPDAGDTQPGEPTPDIDLTSNDASEGELDIFNLLFPDEVKK